MTGGREVAITPLVCDNLIAVRERIAAATRRSRPPAGGRHARRHLQGAARRGRRRRARLRAGDASARTGPRRSWPRRSRSGQPIPRRSGTSWEGSSATRCAASRRTSRAGTRSTGSSSAPSWRAMRPRPRPSCRSTWLASRRRVAAHPRRPRRSSTNCATRAYRVDGLMTVPPADADPRPHFAALRKLAEQVGVPELSMGMTGDFEAAIGEGATYVRVGSAVFGPRPGGVGLRR